MLLYLYFRGGGAGREGQEGEFKWSKQQQVDYFCHHFVLIICHLLSLVQTVTGLGDRVLLLVLCCLSNTSSLARYQVWISSHLWFFDAGRRDVVGQRLDADHLHPRPGRLLDHLGLPCGGQIFSQPGSSCQACPWLVLPCLLWSARSFLLFLTIFSPKM